MTRLLAGIEEIRQQAVSDTRAQPTGMFADHDQWVDTDGRPHPTA